MRPLRRRVRGKHTSGGLSWRSLLLGAVLGAGLAVRALQLLTSSEPTVSEESAAAPPRLEERKAPRAAQAPKPARQRVQSLPSPDLKGPLLQRARALSSCASAPSELASVPIWVAVTKKGEVQPLRVGAGQSVPGEFRSCVERIIRGWKLPPQVEEQKVLLGVRFGS